VARFVGAVRKTAAGAAAPARYRTPARRGARPAPRDCPRDDEQRPPGRAAGPEPDDVIA